MIAQKNIRHCLIQQNSTIRNFVFNRSYDYVKPTIIQSILIICLIISCFACTPSNIHKILQFEPNCSLTLPSWFIIRPQDGMDYKLIYGYSGHYVNENSKIDALKSSAADNLAKEMRVKIKAGWALESTSIVSQSAFYIIEQEWKEKAKQLIEDMHIIDEYKMTSGIIALVAYCKEESTVDNLKHSMNSELIKFSKKTMPKWVIKSKQESNVIYGVGIAPHYQFIGKSWEEAERQAKADLVYQIVSSNKTLQQDYVSTYGSYSKTLHEMEASMILKNCRVIEHMYSYSDKSFFALVKMDIP